MKSMSGLLNIGQTCYVNATIQALRCIKDFVDILRSGKQDDGSMHASLYKVVEAMNDSCLTIRPTTLIRSIVSKRFPLNRPGDAHELLCFVLDRLHEEFKTKVGMTIISNASDDHTKREEDAWNAYKSMFQNGFSNVVPTFYGQMCTSLTSKQTKYKRDVFETFSTLNVPVLKTLYESLDAFFASEDMVEGNQLMDDDEHISVDATKQIYLWRNPRVLIIVLNRFGEEKITDAVKIPEILDMSKYRCPPSQEHFYHLRSICNHIGDANNGHYYTTARWDRQWYEFDDTVVKKCDGWGDGSTAYLLFYELSNKINMIV